MKTITKRSYDQWCAVARSLDIIGERWTLLIVRDLLLGAKRYKDLLDGLPGIGTNLLAQRLRELEAHGVIARTTLPAPANATVYGLTDKGMALEPVIFALGRWGFEYLGKPKVTDAMLPDPFFVSLRASFDPSRDPNLEGRYAFRIGGRLFEVVIEDGELTTREGGATSPDVTFTTDAATLFTLRRREQTPARAIANGKVTVDGDPKALDRFVNATAWSTDMLDKASVRDKG
jgi:DNA-binding HxlR family transcriptional regulator/putative sterol carrier protein